MKNITVKRETIVETMITLLILSTVLSSSLLLFSHASGNKFAGVVYGVAGEPVFNATVVAAGDNGAGFALTDSNGDYLMNEGLGTGDYNMTAIATGYLFGNRTNVHVNVGELTSGIDFFLDLSGGISGKVTDKNTTLPVQGIQIVAIQISGGQSFWYGITDSNGDYNMATNLSTGTYNVTAVLPTGYFTTIVSNVSVTAGEMTRGVNLELEKSGIISGRITAFPSGQPLEGVNVFAASTGEQFFGFTMTNATGQYRIISGLGTDSYTVTAQQGFSFNMTDIPVDVVAGQETSNVDLTLAIVPPTPSGIVTGKVTDMSNGSPIIGATVTASGTGGAGFATTDQNGNYVISSGLDTGTYDVTADAAGYNSTTLIGVNVVVNEVTSGINFQLTKIPALQSGAISGNVQGAPNPVPEFNSAEIAILTTAVITATLMFAKKKITTKNE